MENMVEVSGNRRYKLIVHSTCMSSRELLHGLRRKGFLGAVDIVPASTSLSVFPWSVPMLVSPRGRPVAMDPLSVEEAVAILKGASPPPRGNIEEEFMEAVLYSSYASAIMLVHGDLRPLITPSFLNPALRIPLGRRGLNEASSLLEAEASELYEEYWERVARALAKSIVRVLYWSGRLSEGGLKNMGEGEAASLIISLAGIGRANLPLRPSKPKAAGFITSFLRRAGTALARMVMKEQEILLGDKWFIGLLEGPRALS